MRSRDKSKRKNSTLPDELEEKGLNAPLVLLIARKLIIMRLKTRKCLQSSSKWIMIEIDENTVG